MTTQVAGDTFVQTVLSAVEGSALGGGAEAVVEIDPAACDRNGGGRQFAGELIDDDRLAIRRRPYVYGLDDFALPGSGQIEHISTGHIAVQLFEYRACAVRSGFRKIDFHRSVRPFATEDANHALLPVSYTHLTLPTIYSV